MGRRIGAVRVRRGRHNHCAVVEQIRREGHESDAERTLRENAAKAARVDEQLGGDRLAAVGNEVIDAGVADDDIDDAAFEMAHLQRHGGMVAQERADQVRVEVIAITDLEREIRRRNRRAAMRGEPCRQEIAVRMRIDVAAAPP